MSPIPYRIAPASAARSAAAPPAPSGKLDVAALKAMVAAVPAKPIRTLAAPPAPIARGTGMEPTEHVAKPKRKPVVPTDEDFLDFEDPGAAWNNTGEEPR